MVEVLDKGEMMNKTHTALDKQEGGKRYKDMKIQPIEFIHANNLGFCEANVVKYITRWRTKNGIEDLQKAKHYIDLLIQLEERENARVSRQLDATKPVEREISNEEINKALGRHPSAGVPREWNPGLPDGIMYLSANQFCSNSK